MGRAWIAGAAWSLVLGMACTDSADSAVQPRARTVVSPTAPGAPTAVVSPVFSPEPGGPDGAASDPGTEATGGGTTEAAASGGPALTKRAPTTTTPTTAVNRATPFTRTEPQMFTAPYELGCTADVPCPLTPDAEAQKGNLRSAPSAEPCLYYGPPFACARPGYTSSYAGVRIDPTGRPRVVHGSAVVRRTSTTGDLNACLTLIQESTGDGYYGLSCRPLAPDAAVTIGGMFDTERMTGALGLYVSLTGTGTATVESITFWME